MRLRPRGTGDVGLIGIKQPCHRLFNDFCQCGKALTDDRFARRWSAVSS